MTQQYLAGELSLLLGQLQAGTADTASMEEIAHLRKLVEAGPRPALAHSAVRALEMCDHLCWGALMSDDSATFTREAETCAELWEFGLCADLLEECLV